MSPGEISITWTLQTGLPYNKYGAKVQGSFFLSPFIHKNKIKINSLNVNLQPQFKDDYVNITYFYLKVYIFLLIKMN